MRDAKFNLGNYCQHRQTLRAYEPPKLIIGGGGGNYEGYFLTVRANVQSGRYLPTYLREVSKNPTMVSLQDSDLQSQNQYLTNMLY
jgi:hypothetical protein